MQTITTNNTSEGPPKLNCNTSLRNWLNNMTDLDPNDPNLFSNQQLYENEHPLDIDNPEVEINIGQLRHRSGSELMKTVVIQSQKGDVVLFEGTLLDGRLRAKVDPELAKHSAWKSRVLIGIIDKKMPFYNSTSLFITGLVI